MAENNDLFQFDDFSGVDDRNESTTDNSEAASASTKIENDIEIETEIIHPENSSAGGYDDDAIQHLDWNEHIRRRPGMYIGKLGDGSHAEDGIYVLIKEVVDNSIDEFNMGAGKRIDITLTEEGEVTIRDYGRGIPLGKVREVASEINTGGKFDDKNFKKSVGLNGVGLKAVNALSVELPVEAYTTSGVLYSMKDSNRLVDRYWDVTVLRKAEITDSNAGDAGFTAVCDGESYSLVIPDIYRGVELKGLTADIWLDGDETVLNIDIYSSATVVYGYITSVNGVDDSTAELPEP